MSPACCFSTWVDAVDKLVDGNLGPNVGGLRHLAPAQYNSTDGCAGESEASGSNSPDDLYEMKDKERSGGFTTSFVSSNGLAKRSYIKCSCIIAFEN